MKNQLRKKAESLIEVLKDSDASTDDLTMARLIHELQVHQIELEIQNEELEKSQQRQESLYNQYQNLYNNLPVGSVSITSLGTIVGCNNRLAAMLNTRSDMLIGQNLRVYILDADKPLYDRHASGFYKSNQIDGFDVRLLPESNRPMQLATPDKALWVRIEGTPDELPDGERGFLLSIADIDSQMKAKLELEQMQEKLQEEVRSQTLELILAKEKAEYADHQKSSFLANVSHELRTPMHAILSFTNLGLKHEPGEKLEHYLQNIRTSGLRLLGLVNDLLDLTRMESGNVQVSFQQQDIKALLDQCIGEFQGLLKDKNIQLRVNSAASLECEMDSRLMTQVILNLLSNAIKFSPASSVIDIEVTEVELDDELHCQCLLLRIIDEGIGVPAEEQQQIFNKFTRSSRTEHHAGTGLGLTISSEIISLHHGRIGLSSPPEGRDKGTEVYIRLPLSQEDCRLDGNDLHISDAISLHQLWKTEIDEIYHQGDKKHTLDSIGVADYHNCGLGVWLAANAESLKHLDKLDKLHRKAHLLASESLAYIQSNNLHLAQRAYLEFNQTSEELTLLLDSESGTTSF